MAENSTITVRVPATTANLGPGFDCLGMALDMWNEVSFHPGGEGIHVHIEGEGADKLPHNRNNLILQAAARLYEISEVSFPSSLEMNCRNAIPTSSGLGSSASAVIAGLVGAKKLLNSPISDLDLLALAAEFEGHADNVAACLLGGLVVAVKAESGWIAEKVPMQPLKAVVVLPDIALSTRQARAVLPESINRKDAIANVGRAALLVQALRDGRKDLLVTAMQDCLHQPYRLKLMPGAQEALQAAHKAGAYGAALSGAGPSLIAFADERLDEVSNAMQQAFNNTNIECRVFQTQSTVQGAY